MGRPSSWQSWLARPLRQSSWRSWSSAGLPFYILKKAASGREGGAVEENGAYELKAAFPVTFVRIQSLNITLACKGKMDEVH